MMDAIHTESFHLTAGECGPEQCMSMILVESRAIEVATHHADSWNVGFQELMHHGLTWVLSRIALEMSYYPAIDECYSVTTWIEAVNRHMSFRNFEFCNAEGTPIGYGRSIWVAIDINARTMGDISRYSQMAALTVKRDCPIAAPSHVRRIENPTRTSEVNFGYCDLDFNRHINSVRYLEAIMNQWPLDFHERYGLQRVELGYLRETRSGEPAIINIDDRNPGAVRCDIMVNDGVNCHASMSFRLR